MSYITPWLEVDTIHFEEAIADTSHGGRFSVLPSPNSAPSAVRISRNESELVVEFDYSSPEVTHTRQYADSLLIRYGKMSKKVYALHFLGSPPKEAAAILRSVAGALRKFRRVHGHTHDQKLQAFLSVHCELLRRAAASTVPRLLSLDKSGLWFEA